MVKKIILGTAQFGLNYGINNKNNKPNLEEVFKILNFAYSNGIRTLDTADSYGNAELIISDFIKKFPKKKFKIITKNCPTKVSENNITERILSSCDSFNVQQLYGFMFHNLKGLKRKVRLYDKLLSLKEEGIIKNIGISLYENDEIEYVLKNFYNFDFIQIPFNILDNENMRFKHILDAKKKNIKIHARSVYLQGLFFKELNFIKKKFKDLEPGLSLIKNKLKNENILMEEFALKYVLEKKYINKVLIGVDNYCQIKENIKICNISTNLNFDFISNIKLKNNEMLYPKNW